MWFMSDDPARDAERYIDAREIRLARRPICHCCGENIQEERALHYMTNSVDELEYIEEDE